MSQGNQVVETTPGHSQKLFKAPETFNLTEKNERSHPRQNRQHNDGKLTSFGSLLGLQVELSHGIAVQTTGASKLVVWEVLHGEWNLLSSQQVWYVGIQVELRLD